MTKVSSRSFSNQFSKKSSILESSLVFIASFLVYSANGKTLGSGDTVPNTLLAFNWLFNNSLDLELFRNSYFSEHGIPYYFSESQHGRLTSTYPIGPAIVSFPIYFFSYLFLLASNNFHKIDISSPTFEIQRLFFEKVASSILASFAVVLFYQLSRLKFTRSIATISTFIYAFATNSWTIGSQALWQHGSTNLVLLGILLCLFKANRSEGTQSKLLITAGLLCGLLLGVRPTNLFFLIPIILYSVFIYRRKSLYLFLGLPSLFPTLLWNVYHFGNLTGGYASLAAGYILTIQRFFQGFLGLLLSPSRGLFVYSPILLYAIPGIFHIAKLRAGKDEKLLLCLLPSCLILLLQYSVFPMWWAGHCYGPRFLTDILPILCFLINYVLDFKVRSSSNSSQKFFDFHSCSFSSLLAFSVFVQTVGAFGFTLWEAIPVNIDFDSQVHAGSRLWHIQDTQIERHTQNLLTSIRIKNRSLYVRDYAGEILEIRDVHRKPILSPIVAKAGSKSVLKAKVRNTGSAEWLGYQTGAIRGEVRIRVTILDAKNQMVSEQRLYVSGKPKSQELADAIGMIDWAIKPGKYKLRFQLLAEDFQTLPTRLSNPDQFSTIELAAIIE